MIKSLKDLLDKFSRFTNSLVYDGGICKRLIKISIFFLAIKNDTKIIKIKLITLKNIVKNNFLLVDIYFPPELRHEVNFIIIILFFCNNIINYCTILKKIKSKYENYKICYT